MFREREFRFSAADVVDCDGVFDGAEVGSWFARRRLFNVIIWFRAVGWWVVEVKFRLNGSRQDGLCGDLDGGGLGLSFCCRHDFRVSTDLGSLVGYRLIWRLLLL